MFFRCLIALHVSVYPAGGGTVEILWLICLGLFFLLLKCLCMYVGVHVCVQACVCDVCIHVGLWLCVCGDQKLTLSVPH